MNNYRLPLLAFLLALAITITMDFTGFTMFSSLPLLLLIAIFWGINKISKTEFGLTWSSFKYYGLALMYPLVVLGSCFLVAYAMKDISLEDANWSNVGLNILMASSVGSIMVLLTEEGFFRGWLWGSLGKDRMSSNRTLLLTSGAFMIWHISAVTSGTDYGLPMEQVPIYLINAFLLGLIWGLMRELSGSVLVPSVSHAVWNGLAYELFGFGEKSGALGIENTFLLGPEVGYLGVLFNGLFFFWLWKYSKKNQR